MVSQKSNWRESVLHCSHVCRRQREQFLTPNRGKAELIGWGPRSAVLLPDAFSHMGRSACGATAHDAGHGAVHDAFMTLPAYTRTSEGEVHSLGLGVRNCFSMVEMREGSSSANFNRSDCNWSRLKPASRLSRAGRTSFFRVTTMCLLAAQFTLHLWTGSERCGQRGERTYEGETRHHVAIRMEGGTRTVPAN